MLEACDPLIDVIVDDDVDTCANLSDILTDFGHEVCTAQNGRDGLQRAAETRFDIVLLDLKMPDMDGLELYHELKRFSPTIHVAVEWSHMEVGHRGISLVRSENAFKSRSF